MGKNVKIAVFVPVDHADAVREVLGRAGAGALGNYRYSSFSVTGKGRFIPEKGASPAIGEVGEFEVVDEEKIEVIIERQHARAAIQVMKSAHPYEEVAFDVYELIDEGDL